MKREPRMIISTEGTEGAGKTDFALTAPRGDTGLCYLDFDYGVEGVRGADGIDRRAYDLLAAEWMPEGEAKRYALDAMRRFIADFRDALATRVRSLVVDTFTAAWAGQRLARSEDRYIEYEEEFRSLIRAAYASPHTNVILIHHVKPDWKRDIAGKAYKVAGAFSRDGMDGVLNMVQLGIRQRYVPPQKAGDVLVSKGRFEIDVLKCRDNIGLVGQTFTGMDFATLCACAAPSIDWSR